MKCLPLAMLAAILAGAGPAAASGGDTGRMAAVDRAQSAIWASTTIGDSLATRALQLAALRQLARTDDPAGMRAQSLLLKWGSADDAKAAWAWLVVRHRDDPRLAAVIEGWWDGSALPDATARLQALRDATRSRQVAATARLMLARRDLAEGRRSAALVALRRLASDSGSLPSTLTGAGDPPRLANVAAATLFQAENLAAGAILPPITAATLAGDRPGVAGWRGRPLVIDFWATWCPPCIAALPRLAALQRSNPQLHIVSISGDDRPETVRRWLARRPHPGEQLWIGPSGRVSSEWSNSAYPFYVVVGRNGRIVGTASGIEAAERLIASALR